MRTPKHPTYKDTDRPILVGDYVIEPLGRNHEKGTYPLVVTRVSEKYVDLRSPITDASYNTYPMFVAPADEKSMEHLDGRLSPAHIVAWKKEMADTGVQVLMVTDSSYPNKTSRYLVRLPEGTELSHLRTKDILNCVMKESEARNYDRDSIYMRQISEIKEPFELDQLVDSKVIDIQVTPMTDIEVAFDAMDRIDKESYGETAEDITLIQNVMTKLATQLGIEVPDREFEAEYYDADLDGYY